MPSDPIDLSKLERVEPRPAPARRLPPLARAGLDLFQWVFLFLAVPLGVAIVFLLANEVWAQSVGNDFLRALASLPESDPTHSSLTAALAESRTMRAEYRSYWLGLIERSIGALGLPILTGLLGYIFGARSAE